MYALPLEPMRARFAIVRTEMAFLLHLLTLFTVLTLFGQSAIATEIDPGQAGTGSLLLRTDKTRQFCRGTACRHGLSHHRQWPKCADTGHPALRKPHGRMGLKALCLPLPENSAVDV